MCRLQDDWSRDARYHREWRLQNPGRLTFADYWSVFLLLIIGLSATTIVAAVELFWFKHKGRVRTRYTLYTRTTPHDTAFLVYYAHWRVHV